MQGLAERPIGALSGGQLQRVLIARALAMGPELLLLDEPTASLDERIGHGVWELLEELSKQMTVIVVSHDIGAISRHVRTVACLNRRLYTHPSRELTPEILEATYGCPIDLIAHGHPHRVLGDHGGGGR
jgi:zinc transport system ATP-binding protein